MTLQLWFWEEPGPQPSDIDLAKQSVNASVLGIEVLTHLLQSARGLQSRPEKVQLPVSREKI